MEIERYLLNPHCATADNPEGFEINIGTLLPLGDTDDILEEIGHPLHELLCRFMECEAPHFAADAELAAALYRLPGYDVFFTTYFQELPETAVEEGVTTLPVTIVEAYHRDAHGITYDPNGNRLPDAFFDEFQNHG